MEIGRDKSRPYILRAAFVLFALLLAGCGGSSPVTTPVVTTGDLPSYPNVIGSIATLSSKSFPQAGQYDAVQAFTFTSPDDSATIRLWYKQQLTAKGWQVVADGANLLGLTTTGRDKLIEVFLTGSAAGSAKTRVIVYYATGRKPTPTP